MMQGNYSRPVKSIFFWDTAKKAKHIDYLLFDDLNHEIKISRYSIFIETPLETSHDQTTIIKIEYHFNFPRNLE